MYISLLCLKIAISTKRLVNIGDINIKTQKLKLRIKTGSHCHFITKV